MRHYFLSGTLSARSLRMHHPAATGHLIAPTSITHSITPHHLGAVSAINMASVAPTADQNLAAAA